MDFSQYIMDQALVLIPVLYIIGVFIKQSAVKDEYIPLILLVVSIALSMVFLGVSVQSFIQGILLAGTTVLGHQTYKQLIEKK